MWRGKLWQWIIDLDRLLRGESTRPDRLKAGDIQIPLGGLSIVLTLLGLVYGMCMGTYALFRGTDLAPQVSQFVATTVKVPALFFLTLAVTLPSLYVFNALVGSRLTLAAVSRLLIASLGINLAVLASLGPIVAFFSVSTTSYPFMILLNVVIFAISGLLGLMFLLQTLNRLTISQQSPVPLAFSDTESRSSSVQQGGGTLDPSSATPPREPSALDRISEHVLARHVKTVFGVWVVVFGLVGAQMGWVLRPFIGAPNAPFQLFRRRDSNFFEAVWNSLWALFS